MVTPNKLFGFCRADHDASRMIRHHSLDRLGLEFPGR